MAGKQKRRRPVQGSLDEVPLPARYGAPSPCTFDGRSTVTGRPLSSRTCSAATLFAPYPCGELYGMSPGLMVGCCSVTGPVNRGAEAELTWLPSSSTYTALLEIITV